MNSSSMNKLWIAPSLPWDLPSSLVRSAQTFWDLTFPLWCVFQNKYNLCLTSCAYIFKYLLTNRIVFLWSQAQPGAHPDSFESTAPFNFSGATYFLPMTSLLGTAIASTIVGKLSDKQGRKMWILICIQKSPVHVLECTRSPVVCLGESFKVSKVNS